MNAHCRIASTVGAGLAALLIIGASGATASDSSWDAIRDSPWDSVAPTQNPSVPAV